MWAYLFFWTKDGWSHSCLIGHQFTSLTTLDVFNLASSISPPPFVLGCKRDLFFGMENFTPINRVEKKTWDSVFFCQKFQALIRSSGMTLVVSNEQVLSVGGPVCGSKNRGKPPQNGWWKEWKTLLKWMIWGGTTIFGNIRFSFVFFFLFKLRLELKYLWFSHLEEAWVSVIGVQAWSPRM